MVFFDFQKVEITVLVFYVQLPILYSVLNRKLKSYNKTVSKALGLSLLSFLFCIPFSFFSFRFVHFDSATFFLLLFPIILTNSALKMDKKRVASFLFTVTSFAFVFTFFVFLSIRFLYLFVFSKDTYKVPKAFVAGVALCATDPAVVFSLAHSDSSLFGETLLAVLQGESFFNDVVALLLFNNLRPFLMDTTKKVDVVWVIGVSIGVFVGSFSFGILVGVVFAYVLKRTRFELEAVSEEVLLLVVQVYAPFLLAEVVALNGVAALLGSTLVLSYYSLQNVSGEADFLYTQCIHILEEICECVVFVSLGLVLGQNLRDLFSFKVLFTTFVLFATFLIVRLVFAFFVVFFSKLVLRTGGGVGDVLILTVGSGRGAASLGMIFYFEDSKMFTDVYLAVLLSVFLSVVFSEVALKTLNQVGFAPAMGKKKKNETAFLVAVFKLLDKKLLKNITRKETEEKKTRYNASK